MIKNISEEEFRREKRKYGYTGVMKKDIKQFMESCANVCEVALDGNRTPESIAASLANVIRRMKAPVRVCRRKERVFLVRKEWDENA